MILSLSTLFALLLTVAASPLTNDGLVLTRSLSDRANPTGFNITSMVVNGSGCPAGSAQSIISPDKHSITVELGNFAAAAGPGVAVSSNRVNCQITLGIKVPSGQSVAMSSVDFRGFYSLDSKVTATQTASYFFQGSQITSVANGNLVGPVTGDDYTWRNTFNVADSNTSPCGASTVLNINIAVSVSNSANKAGSGLITDDSVDASFAQTFNMAFGKC